MECDKINNLLDSESEANEMSKFVTREYVKINSLSNTYNENKPARFKTPLLRSDLCGYADAHILVNGTITVDGTNPRDRQNRPLILKNNALFISCIARINNELIEDAEDLDIVMPVYNLLEYSKNYRNKIIGNTYNVAPDDAGYDVNKVGTQKIELAIPLKYLGNFWRALNMPLISCEISLDLKWNKNLLV